MKRYAICLKRFTKRLHYLYTKKKVAGKEAERAADAEIVYTVTRLEIGKRN